MEPGHFEGKHGAHLILIKGRVFHEIHGERGLSHTRARSQNDEVGRLQAVGHLIQTFKARFDAAENSGVGLNGLEFLQHLLHDVPLLHSRQRGAVRLFGNVVHRFFRKRDSVPAFRARHTVFDDLAGRAYQAPVSAVAVDDVVIGFVICRRGGDLREFGEIGDAARLFEVSFPVQLVGKRDEVDGLTPRKDLLHRMNDEFMRFLIKVVLGEFFHQIRRDVVVDEKAPQKSHFRVAVIGHCIDFRHILSFSSEASEAFGRIFPFVFLKPPPRALLNGSSPPLILFQKDSREK